MSDIPAIQRVCALVWPAFLVAGVSALALVSMFDPVNVLECTDQQPLSHIAINSIGFLGLWLVCIASSAATAYFLKPVK